jgi:DNA-binding response OmpR family regulator
MPAPRDGRGHDAGAARRRAPGARDVAFTMTSPPMAFAPSARHTATAPDGQKTELSASEVRLIRALETRPRRVQSRESLMDDDAAATAVAFDRSIDVRISRFRTKLREDPRNPQIIKTVHGAGYMFTPAVEWSFE